MRLVTLSGAAGPRAGVLLDLDGRTRVLELATVCPELPTGMIELLAAGDVALERARDAVAVVDPASLPYLDSVTLLAPVPRPGIVLCVGYNYRGHGAAGAQEDPTFPDVFIKASSSVVGPGASVVLPAASDEVDYEAELAVVIGRAGTAIPPDRALEHVAGYSILNDVSARDWQRRSSQWVLGKSFDTFAPFGPAVVTRDEIPDPHVLDLELTVNGVTTVAASTRDMVFTVPFLVSYLSQVLTLQPGDVIATGTPQKRPEALAHPRAMQDGDVIEITISGLGTLTTPVVGVPAPRPTHTTSFDRPTRKDQD
jgi:acylpyruvate hydrolase